MKSQECFDKLVYKVNCKFGAPLGRYSTFHNKPPVNKKVFDRRVPLDNGAYDKGGAYWGFPNNLRVQYTSDLNYIRFYRTS